MRAIVLFGSLFATTALYADEFFVSPDVSRVTIFTEGALVEQSAFVDLPGGLHTLVFETPSVSAGAPNIQLPGSDSLRLISVEMQSIDGSPSIGEESTLYLQRRETLTEARAALAEFELGDIALQADIASAQASLRAVESLTGPEGQLIGAAGELDPAKTINMLRQLSVEAFTAQAKLDRAEAALDARDLERNELVLAVEVAEAAFDQTPRPVIETSTIVLTVEAERRVAGSLRIENFTEDAAWFPSYRLDLDYASMEGTLNITRQAVVFQNSGFDWTDARVTLSTADPYDATRIDLPNENLLTLIERREAYSSASRDLMVAESALSEPVVQAIELEGQSVLAAQLAAGEPVEFSISDTLSILSGDTNGVLVEIDQIGAPVTLFAEAVAPSDATATLATDFTFDRTGLLLAGDSVIYHNGVYVGSGMVPEVASGDEAKIGLGPLKSVLIKHRILSQEDGDRGLISSTNAREVRTETEIVNLLSHRVPLRLYDVLPVSEAEDLRVTEVSQPRPDERNVEGRRGVLLWSLDLGAGDTQIIRFGYDLAWPKDFEIVPN
ncbi:MAG: mucoidy inhibitor MuiA family protein [Pseudomonadota bacterium]